MPQALRWSRYSDQPPAELTLALLPSLGTSARLWDGVVSRLHAAGLPVQVLRANLPGHGGAPSLSGFTIEDLAHEAVAALHHIGVSRPVAIAGVSMGGAIALEMARVAPNVIGGFAMFNSAVRFGSAAGWAELSAAVRAGGTESLAAGSRAGWFDERTEQAPTAALALLSSLHEIDDDGYLACCAALASYDARGTLGQIAVPGLIVGGSNDHATPAAPMRDIAAALPVAEYQEMPGAHLAVAQHPAIAANLLRAFLSNIERPLP